MATLAERLGYPADAKLLIVTSDDLGLTHASNVATYDALRNGLATSASLMVPCPWARDAAAGYRGEDVGVNLTLNAELDTYRWGPLTHSPSLLDGDGGFPRTVEDAWEHADLEEVRRECRAQIERAIVWGFDVSHLASHLGALQLRPEFFDVYLELAVDFGLPLRLGDGDRRTGRRVPVPPPRRRGGRGVPRPGGRQPAGRPPPVRTAPVRAPRRGHRDLGRIPGIDADELRAAFEIDWSGRVEDHVALRRDPSLRDLVERAGATVVGWRELRDLQRAPEPTPAEHVEHQARVTRGLQPPLHEGDARVELPRRHRRPLRVGGREREVGRR